MSVKWQFNIDDRTRGIARELAKGVSACVLGGEKMTVSRRRAKNISRPVTAPTPSKNRLVHLPSTGGVSESSIHRRGRNA